GRRPELLESEGGLNVIAQDRLAAIDITAQHRIDTFAQQRFGEFLVGLGLALHELLEVLRSCHLLFPSTPAVFALFVVPPIRMRPVDVALLALLRSPREENHQRVAVTPEVDSIGPKSIRYS